MNKWIYITSKHPYDAACSLGINKEVSFILTVPHLNWDMIEEYKYLADNPGKYGIWGHRIEDLWLERMILDIETGNVKLFVGS